MSVCVSLSFNGCCREAFEFYEKCLGGKIQFIATYAGSPMESAFGPEMGQKIMHATLILASTRLNGNDAPAADYRPPQGFSLLYSLNDEGQAETIFRQLSEGGSVRMPLQETFFAKKYGEVTDRFGVPWSISCGHA
jgi:PhnB protein